MKAIVRNDYGYLRVRAAPGTDGAVIGIVNGGLTIEVISVANNWATIALQAGGAPIVAETGGQPAVGYMYAPMLDFSVDPSPPQPAPATVALGVHTMTNGRGIDEADHGCKFIMCMNNLDVARQIKQAHPDAVVMVRHYWGNTIPSISDAIAGLGGATNPAFVYSGLNEADALGQDGADLRRRATFDVALAQAIKQASGATYAACSFSAGCPDFTNPDTCSILRDLYAPYYNSGLLKLDMHLYSPSAAHIDDNAGCAWYERRWEFLFTRCGFDPGVRGIYCSETGVDETGRGGFAGHSTSQVDFQHWCQQFIALQQKPVVVNGTAYATPFIGAAIFQLGGNGDSRWNPYDISNYVSTLRSIH